MAKPRLDDGWVKYAHEIDRALSFADFTKRAQVVLREVLAQIFGARLDSAEISPAELGSASGLGRPHIYHALTELLDANVLILADNGRYQFNKDYERWTYKGDRRLTVNEVQFCKSAPKRWSSYKPEHGDDPASKCASPGTKRRPKFVPNQAQSCASPGTDIVPNQAQICAQPGTKGVPHQAQKQASHIGTERGIEEKKNTEEVQEGKQQQEELLSFTGGKEVTLEPTNGDSKCPAFLMPDENPSTAFQEGEHKHPREWSERFYRTLWTLFECSRLNTEWLDRQEWFTAAIWEAVVAQVRRQGSRPKSIRYLLTIAQQYEKSGIPALPTKEQELVSISSGSPINGETWEAKRNREREQTRRIGEEKLAKVVAEFKEAKS